MQNVFDKVRLTPAQLRTVAERRYADADYLRNSRANARANGAIYLAGFTLECLLKAQLLEKFRWLQRPGDTANMSIPDRRIYRLCYQQHDLAGILEHLPELTEKLLNLGRRQANPTVLLQNLQRLCGEWTVYARYSPKMITLQYASEFIDRVKE